MKLLKDGLIYLGGEIFAKALPFLLLPYLTRKLGAEGFGELAYWQTVCILIFIVACLAQDGAVSRYFYVYGRRNLRNLVFAGTLYTAVPTAVGLISALCTQSLLLAATVGAAAAQSLLATQLSLRQCRKQAAAYAGIQIGSGIAATLLTVGLLEYTDGMMLEKRFAALLVGQAAAALPAFLLTQTHTPSAKISPRRLLLSLRYLLCFGLPLLPHQLSLFAKNQFDRILIFHYYPKDELGIYAAAAQLAAVVSVLLMAVNKAAVPHLFGALKQKTLTIRRLRRWAAYGLAAAPAAALITFLLPESLLLAVVGRQYAGIHAYTVLLVANAALSLPYLILVNYLFYLGKNTTISAISLISAVVHLLLLFLLAGQALYWIAGALICSNLLGLLLLWYAARESDTDGSLPAADRSTARNRQ